MANDPASSADLPKAAVKYDAGKPRFDLVPAHPLEQLAKLYTKGADKYEENNWLKGFRFGRTFAALQRHAWAWQDGEDIDPETGLSHLAAVAWNAFALMEFQHRGIGEDDRPCKTVFALKGA